MVECGEYATSLLLQYCVSSAAENWATAFDVAASVRAVQYVCHPDVRCEFSL